MDKTMPTILFALLRCAVFGGLLSEKERMCYDDAELSSLLEIAKKHDVAHILVLGLKNNGLLTKENNGLNSEIFKAFYRYEKIKNELDTLCDALEEAKIPYILLKGSVIRKYYSEPWIRTSCDIDVLVHKSDLNRAGKLMETKLKYKEFERSTHDISYTTPAENSVELHFDLVEEGRAKDAISILSSAWENVSLCDGSEYRYEMNDAFFYFYHIAHMAKHFENGGCGIRPFIDLWILENMQNVDKEARDALLSLGNLLRFAEVSRNLCKIWFDGGVIDGLYSELQAYIISGGVYGTFDNRVAFSQQKKGGRIGYMLSRMFISYEKLRRYYPILEKHKWLVPFMQVRRWFMLLKPDVAKMAKREIAVNGNISKSAALDAGELLKNIGL